jgi:hypothetical protein
MILTDEQIEYIDTNLKLYGIASEELRNDVLDHMCTYMEENDFPDFDTAYQEALQKFGGYAAMGNLQKETYLQVTVKRVLQQKKILYICTLTATMLSLTGLLFKVFHWPGAMVLLFLGIAAIILIVLPLYFYQQYRNAENKLYNQ